MSARTQERDYLAIIFRLRERLFALEQRGTATLLPWLQRYMPPSGVPGLPAWCLGLLNVRGTVQLVVDLGCLLAFGPSEIGDQSRLIFIEQGTAQLGMVVDQEIGVRMLRQEGTAPDGASPFACGSARLEDQPVIVLDGGQIIHQVATSLRAPAYLR